MLTFFTTAKPFVGHDAIIQRNALMSWKLLHPDIEVIVFGDDPGASEVCKEYGLRHEPEVERHNRKFPFANAMFTRAQQIARHDYLCYSNCDIVLFGDFLKAFEKARAWRKRFLLVSRRWDTDLKKPIDFTRPDWAEDLRQLAVTRGFYQIPDFVDFFLFSKGVYQEVPPLIVGYAFWDSWMVWKALSENIPVLDASPYLVPVHQNHEYNTTQRTKGSFADDTAQRNFGLVGGWKHVRHAEDATYRLSRGGVIYKSPFRYKRQASNLGKFFFYDVWHPILFFFLGVTRPLRNALGLRAKAEHGPRGRI
jgi:hypothetical protein